MTTYLVTGACGFIGSNFVHDVLEREPGATVVALDNLSFAANEANLDGVRDRIHFVVDDICNFTGMVEVYGRFRARLRRQLRRREPQRPRRARPVVVRAHQRARRPDSARGLAPRIR